MRRAQAAAVVKLLRGANRVGEYEIRVRHRVPKPFHHMADERESVGYVELDDGDVHWHLLFIEWKTGTWYLVVYPDDRSERSGPLIEMHEVTEETNGASLHWRYKPSKRDGRNPARVARFAEAYGDGEAMIRIPRAKGDVRAFLEAVVRLARHREAADRLDEDAVEDTTFVEGARVQARHIRSERSRALVERAKRAALDAHGRIPCRVCGFDFEETYGEVGRGFIEAHHVKPLSELTESTVARVSDLALVCANCHRMLHRRRPWLTMKDIGLLLRPSRSRPGPR